jgi:group I intron endonuclease
MKRNYYLKRHCGIYLIQNIVNGMRYVGQSRDIFSRWIHHSSPNKSGIGTAIAAEGPQCFSFQVLEICAEEKLNERERYWILHHGCLTPSGYNKKLPPAVAAVTPDSHEVQHPPATTSRKKKVNRGHGRSSAK